MEVGQPTQLAKLPRAGLTGDGKSRFCQVYALHDAHRKKRQEICAAVDGNSVNIIEVVNGRNVVSWPVPPDVTFICDPISVRIRADDGSYYRRTWCVVQRRHVMSVECYEEAKINKDTTHQTSSCVIKASAARVVTLQLFGPDVAVVVQEDGSITVIPHGKNSTQGEFSIKSTDGVPKLLTAHVLQTDAARASILKSRLDLASNLSQDGMVIVAAYTVFQSVQNTPSPIHLGIWTLDTIVSLKSDHSLIPTATCEIDCTAIRATPRRARLVFGCQKLEVSDTISTTTFDLTRIRPQNIAIRKPVASDAISEVELANNLYFSLSSDKFLVYNASFNSVLASSPRRKSELKRKRNASSSIDMCIIAYFSQLKRVVTADNHSVYAIDIHSDNASTRPFQKSSLLVGNILRGNSQTSEVSGSTAQFDLQARSLKLEKMPDSWPNVSKELDALAVRQDAQGFENKLLQCFGQISFSDLKKSAVPVHVTDYVLSRIFRLEPDLVSVTDTSYRLKVVLLVPHLLRWLIENDYLEDRQVLRALSTGGVARVSSTGLVAQALLETDTELTIMQDYITKSPYINTIQLCSVVKSLLTTALGHSNKHMQKTLRHELKLEMDGEVDAQALAVGVGPDELTASTTTTICLSHALQRLALVGHSIISQEFRKSFGQKETLALIQFLRQQLFLGGYTRLVENWKPFSPLSSPTSSDEEITTNPNPQISLEGLVVLLNGCVDALGPVGILGSEEHEEFIQDLLPDILSEITTASKAVEDSTLLQGLVRETLRYAESVERQPFEVRFRIQNESSRFRQKGEVVTLYTEPDTEETGVVAGSALPTGLKAAEDISKYKMRKGGGQMHRRSTREMGMLKDRLRSSYAFERLVL